MKYPIIFEEFQHELKKGRLVGLRCRDCGEIIFPPKGTCSRCRGIDFEKIELSGEGNVKTFTVIRVPPEGMKPSYVVVMVELKEGPWAVGRLLEVDPDNIDISVIGKRVKMEPFKSEGLGEDRYTIGFRLI